MPNEVFNDPLSGYYGDPNFEPTPIPVQFGGGQPSTIASGANPPGSITDIPGGNVPLLPVGGPQAGTAGPGTFVPPPSTPPPGAQPPILPNLPPGPMWYPGANLSPLGRAALSTIPYYNVIKAGVLAPQILWRLGGTAGNILKRLFPGGGGGGGGAPGGGGGGPGPGWYDPAYLRSIGYEPGQGTGSLWPGAGPSVGPYDVGAYGVGGGGGSFFHQLAGGRATTLPGAAFQLGQGTGGVLPSFGSLLYMHERLPQLGGYSLAQLGWTPTRGWGGGGGPADVAGGSGPRSLLGGRGLLRSFQQGGVVGPRFGPYSPSVGYRPPDVSGFGDAYTEARARKKRKEDEEARKDAAAAATSSSSDDESSTLPPLPSYLPPIPTATDRAPITYNYNPYTGSYQYGANIYPANFQGGGIAGWRPMGDPQALSNLPGRWQPIGGPFAGSNMPLQGMPGQWNPIGGPFAASSNDPIMPPRRWQPIGGPFAASNAPTQWQPIGGPFAGSNVPFRARRNFEGPMRRDFFQAGGIAPMVPMMPGIGGGGMEEVRGFERRKPSTDTVPAMLSPGEMVLTRPQQAALRPIPGRAKRLRPEQRAAFRQIRSRGY